MQQRWALWCLALLAEALLRLQLARWSLLLVGHPQPGLAAWIGQPATVPSFLLSNPSCCNNNACCRLTGSVPTFLNSFPELRYVRLDNNQFEGGCSQPWLILLLDREWSNPAGGWVRDRAAQHPVRQRPCSHVHILYSRRPAAVGVVQRLVVAV